MFYFLLNGYSQDGPVSCGPISKKSFNPVLTLRDEFHNKPTDVDLFAPQGTWVIFASQLPKNTYFNQKIRINSDLIVDVPLMFINCELEMLHVNIEIISGGELRLFNSRLFAFTTTWNGIEVKDNGFLVLARNRIEDAVYKLLRLLFFPKLLDKCVKNESGISLLSLKLTSNPL